MAVVGRAVQFEGSPPQLEIVEDHLAVARYRSNRPTAPMVVERDVLAPTKGPLANLYEQLGRVRGFNRFGSWVLPVVMNAELEQFEVENGYEEDDREKVLNDVNAIIRDIDDLDSFGVYMIAKTTDQGVNNIHDASSYLSLVPDEDSDKAMLDVRRRTLTALGLLAPDSEREVGKCSIHLGTGRTPFIHALAKRINSAERDRLPARMIVAKGEAVDVNTKRRRY